MVQAENLVKGQGLKVNLEAVRDRLPKKILEELIKEPYGKLIGYKMVDGNQFGLVLKFKSGSTSWFFESELIEIIEEAN